MKKINKTYLTTIQAVLKKHNYKHLPTYQRCRHDNEDKIELLAARLAEKFERFESWDADATLGEQSQKTLKKLIFQMELFRDFEKKFYFIPKIKNKFLKK